MSVGRLKKVTRYLGLFFLSFFFLSIPLHHLYLKWDSHRVLRAYGGDPEAGLRAVPFLARYLEEHLEKGMTKEEVHRVIHHYWRVKKIDEPSDDTETEVYIFDPLETLVLWASYQNGRFSAIDNIDRSASHLEIVIILTSLIVGLTFVLASFIPFERFLPSVRE